MLSSGSGSYAASGLPVGSTVRVPGVASATQLDSGLPSRSAFVTPASSHMVMSRGVSPGEGGVIPQVAPLPLAGIQRSAPVIVSPTRRVTVGQPAVVTRVVQRQPVGTVNYSTVVPIARSAPQSARSSARRPEVTDLLRRQAEMLQLVLQLNRQAADLCDGAPAAQDRGGEEDAAQPEARAPAASSATEAPEATKSEALYDLMASESLGLVLLQSDGGSGPADDEGDGDGVVKTPAQRPSADIVARQQQKRPQEDADEKGEDGDLEEARGGSRGSNISAEEDQRGSESSAEEDEKDVVPVLRFDRAEGRHRSLTMPLLGGTDDDGEGEASGRAMTSAMTERSSLVPMLRMNTSKFQQVVSDTQNRLAVVNSKDIKKGTMGLFRSKNGQSDDSFDPASSFPVALRETGICVRIAQHEIFAALTMGVIIFSIFWLGVETNYNKALVLVEAPLTFQIVDNIICFFFAFELLVRVGAMERRRRDAFRGWAFQLDAFLVAITIWETWIQSLIFICFETRAHTGGFISTLSSLRILRVFRILRFARSARVWQYIPELLTFMEGMLRGIRAVGTSFVLLAGVIYVFAIVFTQLLAGTPAGKGSFDTVFVSMEFLFVTSLCSIDKAMIGKMLDAGWIYWFLWLLYLLMANLTIMRMLTGMMLSLVQDVNKEYKDHSMMIAIEHELTELVTELDEDSNGVISREEFKQLVEDPVTIQRLMALGVDVATFSEAVMDAWSEEDTLDVPHLTAQMLKHRGSNAATLKDVIKSRRMQAEMLQVLGDDIKKHIRDAFGVGKSPRKLTPT